MLRLKAASESFDVEHVGQCFSDLMGKVVAGGVFGGEEFRLGQGRKMLVNQSKATSTGSGAGVWSVSEAGGWLLSRL